MLEIALLSFALSMLSSTISIKLSRKSRRNIIVKRDYVIIGGKDKLYVYGIRLESVDPLILKKEGLKLLREYTTLLASCCPEASLEVRLKRKYVPKEKVLKKLEREITALRVMLEEDRSNKYLERKLKRLERLYSAFQSGRLPSEIELDYLVIAKERHEALAAVEKLHDRLATILGASFSRLSGRQILSIMLFKDTKRLLTSSEVASLTFSIPRKVNLSGIVLGTDVETEEIVLVSEEDVLHHIGVFGATGSGKSTTLATLAKRASSLLGVNVIVFDPKGDLIEMVKDDDVRTYGPIVAPDVKSRREEAIKSFEEDILNKILQSEKTDMLKTIVIIDEAWLISQDLLEVLLREGRSRGVGVVLATQSINDLKPQLLTNIRTMVLMRHSAEDLSDKLKAVLGDYAEELPYLRTGEAILMRGLEVRKIRVDVELDVDINYLKVQGVKA